MRRPLSRLLFALGVMAVVGGAGGAELKIGYPIADFELADVHGQARNLSDYSQHKLLVVVFLGTECPLARLYAPRLQELAQQFESRGVGMVGINANPQDALTEIAAYARQHGVTFPILKDTNQSVMTQFGARRTPEVFLLDEQRVVRYRGRIDDQYGVGFQRPNANRHDLALAIDAVLSSEPIETPITEAPGCLISPVERPTPQGDITYCNQIAGILQRRCVECHRQGEVAPFALTEYQEVVGWADMIREVVDAGRMPPWFADPQFGQFKNDCSLTADEKSLIHTWIDNGCPEGDRSQLPEAAQFVDGWRIGEPDHVVQMAEAFKVPAEGVVDYQHFVVDLNLTEDKWLQAAEARPGNRAVVHHIVAYVLPPGAKLSGGGQAQLFGDRLAAVYAPGTPPWEFPPGTAIPLQKGSKLVLQLHYTPNGTEQEDISYVGLKFADPATVKRRASSRLSVNFTFAIPPGADDYEVTSRYKFRKDMLLLNLYPHMHLRGKDFRIEAEYPDGTREVLLNVPRYDFGWQIRYDLVEPKKLPKGSIMHCVAHFDNSAKNPANPNPEETVRFGEQTWEEMMVGFFTTAPAEEDVEAPGAEAGETVAAD